MVMRHLPINTLITRLILMQKIKTLLVLGALLGSAAAYAAKCDLSTVEGTYTQTVTGWSGSGDDRQPLAGVRVKKFEIVGGLGKVTTLYSATATDGLQAVPSAVPSVYGSYKVSAVGKGSCSVEVKRPFPTLFTAVGVTSDNGNHISAISTSAGSTTSNEYVRVSR